jgi:hypothetical protein
MGRYKKFPNVSEVQPDDPNNQFDSNPAVANPARLRLSVANSRDTALTATERRWWGFQAERIIISKLATAHFRCPETHWGTGTLPPYPKTRRVVEEV